MTKIRPKRSDGYWLCEQINGYDCDCKNQGGNPCQTIGRLLTFNEGDRDKALKWERERIRLGMLSAGTGWSENHE